MIEVTLSEVDRMARFLWFVALMICGAATSKAQGTPPSASDGGQYQAASPLKLIPRTHEERESRYRSSHRMILNVLAVDEHGQPVPGLTPQDFALLDNGRTQELASFREVNGDQGIAPPHIILIVDALNSGSGSIADEIKETDKYLQSNQGRLRYPTSVAILSTSGFKASRTSSDGSVLLQESAGLFKDIHPDLCEHSQNEASHAFSAARLSCNNHIDPSAEKTDDGNCLNEKFTLSLSALTDLANAQQDVPGRVIVIWIGPGWPHLTGPEFHADTAEIKANFFDHIIELSRILREAQVTVDAVFTPEMLHGSELRSVRAKPLAAGPLTEEQATASDLALEAIVTQSGGRVLEGRSIADAIARCVADVQTYYAVSFDSEPSSKGDEYHSLEVKVDKPGAKVFTNTLYYGEP